MTLHKTCDGVGRRDFLRVGALGGVTGLSLSGFLRIAAAGQAAGNAPAKAAILINLTGGPSHMDTFDLKPNAPSEVRGSFNPIKTNVPGVEISEHLPLLAQCADKYALLRGVSHTLAAHNLGQEYVNTGTRPIASLSYPGYGAVIAKELASERDLPSAVAIPRASGQSAGFLGVQYAPLATNATPKVGSAFAVRGISLRPGLTIEDMEKRTSLLRDLDQTFASIESRSGLLTGLDQFGQQAYEMITSKRAKDAFDISKESPKFTKPFGTDPFGASCLLATRLVEAGVKFCTVTLGGWDTHQDNFTRLKTNNLPKLDQGLSALFNGLEAKGLLDSTIVLVTGEFGRTPKINTRSAEGGRDHYPRCMFMLLAGGGIRGGQVYGESDATASAPKNDAIRPDDVAATYYHCLGIDPSLEYQTNTGRPITLVRDGRILTDILA